MSMIEDYTTIINTVDVKWLKLKDIDKNEWLKEAYIIKHDLKLVNLTPQQINNLNDDDFKSKLDILKIDDQLYWSKLIDSSYIPHNAVKIDYDKKIKNFIYIGRILQNNNGQHYFFGTVSNYCEYIPAVAIKLSTSIDSTIDVNDKEQKAQLNYSATNYEILCAKYQPSKLQYSCIKSILRIDMINSVHLQMYYNPRLPLSLRKYIWPEKLMMNDCLKKLKKICSKNLKYEISIGQSGVMKLSRLNKSNVIESSFIYEKDIDCLLLCKNGVFLLFDYKQFNRRPISLHEFTCPIKIYNSIYLKLTNDGKLKLIKRSDDLTIKICLINLEDYLETKTDDIVYSKVSFPKKTIEQTKLYVPHAFEIATINENDRDKFKIIGLVIQGFRVFQLPILILKLIMFIIKKVFNTIFSNCN